MRDPVGASLACEHIAILAGGIDKSSQIYLIARLPYLFAIWYLYGLQRAEISRARRGRRLELRKRDRRPTVPSVKISSSSQIYSGCSLLKFSLLGRGDRPLLARGV